MTHTIMPFDYNGSVVRVILDESGRPWWVAKDVCEVLDLKNVAIALEKLDEDEKLTSKILISGQHREVWTINEPGLYTLIIRSNKPEALKFRRWITHEVLPSIRRTGRYEVPDPGQARETEILGRHTRLKINQKIRLLELAYKINDLSPADRERFFSDFDRMAAGMADGRSDENGVLPLDGFLDAACTMDPDSRVSKNDLYSAYISWATSEGEPCMGRSRFFRELYRNPGISCTRPTVDGCRVWMVNGVCLNS